MPRHGLRNANTSSWGCGTSPGGQIYVLHDQVNLGKNTLFANMNVFLSLGTRWVLRTSTRSNLFAESAIHVSRSPPKASMSISQLCFRTTSSVCVLIAITPKQWADGFTPLFSGGQRKDHICRVPSFERCPFIKTLQ